MLNGVFLNQSLDAKRAVMELKWDGETLFLHFQSRFFAVDIISGGARVGSGSIFISRWLFPIPLEREKCRHASISRLNVCTNSSSYSNMGNLPREYDAVAFQTPLGIFPAHVCLVLGGGPLGWGIRRRTRLRPGIHKSGAAPLRSAPQRESSPPPSEEDSSLRWKMHSDF